MLYLLFYSMKNKILKLVIIAKFINARYVNSGSQYITLLRNLLLLNKNVRIVSWKINLDHGNIGDLDIKKIFTQILPELKLKHESSWKKTKPGVLRW